MNSKFSSFVCTCSFESLVCFEFFKCHIITVNMYNYRGFLVVKETIMNEHKPV